MFQWNKFQFLRYGPHCVTFLHALLPMLYPLHINFLLFDSMHRIRHDSAFSSISSIPTCVSMSKETCIAVIMHVHECVIERYNINACMWFPFIACRGSNEATYSHYRVLSSARMASFSSSNGASSFLSTRSNSLMNKKK